MKKRIFRTVSRCCPYEEAGIAFSGGVDSSLLALTCVELNKDVTLITVGFPESPDVKWSKIASSRLNLKHLVKELSLNDLENALKYVSSIVKFTNPIELELSIAFYLICDFAKEKGINIILSAQGADELFCGYDKYRSAMERGGKEEVTKLIHECLNQAFRDRDRANTIARHLGIKLAHPFLEQDFIEFCLSIPVELKMSGPDDQLRKRIWRNVAIEIGVPEEIALKHKKALQYGSGIHKNLVKIARKWGFSGKGCLTRLVSYLMKRANV